MAIRISGYCFAVVCFSMIHLARHSHWNSFFPVCCTVTVTAPFIRRSDKGLFIVCVFGIPDRYLRQLLFWNLLEMPKPCGTIIPVALGSTLRSLWRSEFVFFKKKQQAKLWPLLWSHSSFFYFWSCFFFTRVFCFLVFPVVGSVVP